MEIKNDFKNNFDMFDYFLIKIKRLKIKWYNKDKNLIINKMESLKRKDILKKIRNEELRNKMIYFSTFISLVNYLNEEVFFNKKDKLIVLLEKTIKQIKITLDNYLEYIK